MRNHLVGVHVRRSAAAGLEHIHDKLGIVRAFGYLIRGLLDRRRQMPRQFAEFSVDFCGAGFDEPQRPQKRPRETEPADGEILDRALRLRSVQSAAGTATSPMESCSMRAGAAGGISDFIPSVISHSLVRRISAIVTVGGCFAA